MIWLLQITYLSGSSYCLGQPIVGRTKKEREQTFNKSNHFLKEDVDYRGASYDGTYHPGDN